MDHPSSLASERDAGLAAERTELAWSRSALSLLACGAATLKGIPNVTNGRPTAGVALLVLGGLFWFAGVPLARQRARVAATGIRPVARRRDLAPVAIGAVVVGLASLAIAAFFPG